MTSRDPEGHYNMALTHDEEQRQLIFHVVEHIAGI